MRIRVLEDVVVDRIAAGEVVERPASVLKELVENALDAGATTLDVRLRRGGIDLVRVTDDGCGMSEDEAVLCIERHATSKIVTADDLVGVATFGFRGEALPSIASVSHFELRTRRHDDEAGTRVVVDGGTIQSVGPVGAPVGTDIAVRGLFQHVPARRKFLRGPGVELNHALEAVRRAILLRPDVDVRVTHDGRELLRAPAGAGDDALAARVRDVLGVDPARLVRVDVDEGNVGVRGLVGPSTLHRATSTGGVYLYVNGRFVRDPVLRRALTEAYRGLLPGGRFPVAVLDVRVPPDTVDVNVHPAKTEVRFADARRVADAVSDGVRASLRAAVRGAAAAEGPTAPFSRAPVRPGVGAMPEETGQLPLPGASALPAPWLAAEPSMPRAQAASAAHERTGLSDPAEAAGSASGRGVSHDGTRDADLSPGASAPTASHDAAGVLAVPGAPTPTPTPTPTRTPTVEGRARSADAAAGERWRSWRPVARVGGLVVASGTDGLAVLDVEAASRVLAAWRLARRAASGAAVGSPLLVPVVVPLPRAAAEAILDAADALASHGVTLMAFGPGRLAVTSLPPEIGEEAVEGLLAEVATRGLDAALAACASLAAPDSDHELATRLAELDEAGIPAGQPWVARLTEERLRPLLTSGAAVGAGDAG